MADLEDRMSALEEKVLECIVARGMANPLQPVLLMVSGGSDSTALAYLVHALHEREEIGPLAMLHVNHTLRGADAESDARFVEQLASKLEIPLTLAVVDVGGIAESERANIEAVARRERYSAAQEALTKLCMSVQAPVSEGRIFVAHTVDDRIENFYMRSIVGTGPGGFRSMLYLNGQVARPLLDCGRQELRDYINDLAESGADVARDDDGKLWRDDAEIVPLAKERNPRLDETLTRTMNLIADEDDMLDEMAEKLVEQHVVWLEPAEEGCVLSPWLAAERMPLQRRIAVKVLECLLGPDARIETASVDAVLAGFESGKPLGGYVANIQGNLAVSANRNGIRIEPMASFRMRRKKQ